MSKTVKNAVYQRRFGVTIPSEFDFGRLHPGAEIVGVIRNEDSVVFQYVDDQLRSEEARGAAEAHRAAVFNPPAYGKDRVAVPDAVYPSMELPEEPGTV